MINTQTDVFLISCLTLLSLWMEVEVQLVGEKGKSMDYGRRGLQLEGENREISSWQKCEEVGCLWQEPSKKCQEPGGRAAAPW